MGADGGSGGQGLPSLLSKSLGPLASWRKFPLAQARREEGQTLHVY